MSSVYLSLEGEASSCTAGIEQKNASRSDFQEEKLKLESERFEASQKENVIDRKERS